MTSRLGFLFEARNAGIEAIEQTWEIIKSGVSEGLKTTGIIEALKGAGLSYKRQSMLSDIRRMGAVAHIGVEAGISADRAMHFYDAYIEPYRRDRGLTAKQAWENYHTWRRREEAAEIELDELDEVASEYEWYSR